MTEQAKEPAYRKRIGYHGALLGGFATIAAAMLLMGNISTRTVIEQRLAEDLQASLSQVIPASLHENNLLDNRRSIRYRDRDVTVYQGIKNDKTTAVAYTVSNQGYAGEIVLMMGVNAEGEILGVRVISHTETPGLGDKMEVAKDDWIFSFNGLSFKKLAKDKWKVKKDGGNFDQFSGATITPRAVVNAIKQGLELFSQQREKLLYIEKPVVAIQDPKQPTTKKAKSNIHINDKQDKKHEQ
jgi:electron transport complex protein RnfG